MPSARGVVAAAFALALLAPSASRADVADYVGKPIASVRLVIEGRDTTDPALLQVVETRAGTPLSMAQVRESVAHLFSLGRFEDVRIDATLEGGAVALRYDLSPIHPVARIELAGNVHVPGVDRGQLLRAVVDRYGVSPPVGRAADVARLVADTLQQRGYLHASVAPRAELEHAPDRATLVLTIDPGARTRIGTVDIVGTPDVPRAELLSRLHAAPGAAYERDALAAAIVRHIERLRKRGYYEAKLTPSVALVDGDRVANLTLNVVRGPHVRVVFVGDPLAANQRAELVPIETEGSADEDLLEDSSNRIEEYLRGQGYRDAAAPHARVESNGELLVTFTVTKGRQYRVEHVVVTGNTSIPLAELEPNLRLRDGQPFSDARLDRDLSVIEALYHRRGFAAAKAQPSVQPRPAAAADLSAPVPVVVEIAVREGARTVVGTVELRGNRSVPAATLRPAVGLQTGQPYTDAQLASASEALQQQYANLGYQNATVDVSPGFNADFTRADPVLTVHEGPRLFVDHVLIVGNVRTATSTIEHELQFKPGDPLGVGAVTESQRRLASLGLFRSTRITQLAHGGEDARDVLVRVEEAPATTIGYGAGGEVLQVLVQNNGVAVRKLEFAPRASFQVGRRNLFGKNRSVNLFTSLALFPSNSPVFAGQAPPTTNNLFGFSEYRVLGTFQEPHVFNTAADAVVTGVLEQQIRSSFNFARRAAGVQVARRITRTLSAAGNYQLASTQTFDQNISPADQSLIDRAFPKVRLSSFSSSLINDTRDDPVAPGTGHYLSANGQVAARAIGSEVGFVKSFFTAQAFRTLPHSNRAVLAVSARLGLATGFPRDISTTDANGQQVVQEQSDLPISERFFAGGDTTVRGFALDALGRPDTIVDGFPNGGNGLVIFNAELRMPVWSAIGVVGFVDSGNVFASASDVNLGDLRGAVGFGLRIKSPVGPIRIDLGFKLHREFIPQQGLEGRTALHISFGQAF
jgi:outer membrane protein insertion porin family